MVVVGGRGGRGMLAFCVKRFGVGGGRRGRGRRPASSPRVSRETHETSVTGSRECCTPTQEEK